MSIQDFLLSNVEADETKEVKFKRFKSPFVIKSIDETVNDDLKKRATRKVRNRQGISTPDFNNDQYVSELMVACVVEPDLHNAELQEFYGTTGDAGRTLKKMLRAGEYATLMQEIQTVNGFDESINDLVEEAKN